MTIEIVVAISIVILAVIVYFSTYYLKKTHYTDIDRLDHKKKDVFSYLPNEKADKLERMAISGQSKASAEMAVSKVNLINDERLPEVEAFLFDAEQATDRYRFKQASDYQNRADESLKAIEEDLKQIVSTIDELLQREEANLKKSRCH